MAMRRHQADGEVPVRYQPVPLAQIAPAMREAVLVSEDHRFYVHGGIDYQAIREALGMSAAHLAARINVTRQTIRDLEHSEATGKITLESLNRLAAALGCRVIYALVPAKPLDEMQRARAQKRITFATSIARNQDLQSIPRAKTMRSLR